jgi:hypothetical protein
MHGRGVRNAKLERGLHGSGRANQHHYDSPKISVTFTRRLPGALVVKSWTFHGVQNSHELVTNGATTAPARCARSRDLRAREFATRESLQAW